MITLNSTRLRCRLNSILLVWVDGSIDENQSDCQHTLDQLRAVVKNISLFRNTDDCVKFFHETTIDRMLVITSGALGQDLVQQIHALPQVDTIYIFCGNVTRHETWAVNWAKIRGVHNRIQPICEDLQRVIIQWTEDNTIVSLVQTESQDQGNEGSTGSLQQWEASFVYIHLLKMILLETKCDENGKEHFVKMCRFIYSKNTVELTYINEFQQEYQPSRAIWWYTRGCFTYQMLHEALNYLESNLIVNISFFLHDVYDHLKRLYHEQLSQYQGESFIVYRGQGLSTQAFNRIQNNPGKLMLFKRFFLCQSNKNSSIEPCQVCFNEREHVWYCLCSNC